MTPLLLTLALAAQNPPLADPPLADPPPPDWLTGRVVTDAGEPVEGATVDAYSWVPGHTATTDAQGRFELRGVPTDGDPVEVLVTALGRSPAHRMSQTLGEDVTFELGDADFIAGRVTDLDGDPAAGATVTARFPMRRGQAVVGHVVLTAAADADGRYRIGALPGEVELSAAMAGVGVASLAGLTVDGAETWDATLLPGVRLEARVVDAESGAPVEGFALYTWQKPIVSAVSDAEGRLVIDDLAEGRRELSCGGGPPMVVRDGRPVPAPEGHDGPALYLHGPFGRWWSPDAVKEWERKAVGPDGWQRNFDGLTFDLLSGMEPVTIEVERGVAVSGRATDPEGNPVEGATVAPARPARATRSPATRGTRPRPTPTAATRWSCRPRTGLRTTSSPTTAATRSGGAGPTPAARR